MCEIRDIGSVTLRLQGQSAEQRTLSPSVYVIGEVGCPFRPHARNCTEIIALFRRLKPFGRW